MRRPADRLYGIHQIPYHYAKHVIFFLKNDILSMTILLYRNVSSRPDGFQEQYP